MVAKSEQDISMTETGSGPKNQFRSNVGTIELSTDLLRSNINRLTYYCKYEIVLVTQFVLLLMACLFKFLSLQFHPLNENLHAWEAICEVVVSCLLPAFCRGRMLLRLERTCRGLENCRMF